MEQYIPDRISQKAAYACPYPFGGWALGTVLQRHPGMLKQAIDLIRRIRSGEYYYVL